MLRSEDQYDYPIKRRIVSEDEDEKRRIIQEGLSAKDILMMLTGKERNRDSWPSCPGTPPTTGMSWSLSSLSSPSSTTTTTTTSCVDCETASIDSSVGGGGGEVGTIDPALSTIFGFLDVTSLAVSCMVSKHWRCSIYDVPHLCAQGKYTFRPHPSEYFFSLTNYISTPPPYSVVEDSRETRAIFGYLATGWTWSSHVWFTLHSSPPGWLWGLD